MSRTRSRGAFRAAFLFVMALTASSASAQTVEEIIARNIEAKGGAAVQKGTTSVRTTGKGLMQGAEMIVISSTKRPYYVRNEMELSGQKMVQGFDGETMWMSMGGAPAQALPPGPQTEVLKQTSQIDSPLLDYKDKGTKIELGEPLTEDGRQLHHLVVSPKTGPTMHYYIDPATHLDAKMVVDVEERGQKMKMEMRFSDYKAVEGRTVPFTITQLVNGKQVGQITFQKVEFNLPLDASIFRMPKSAGVR